MIDFHVKCVSVMDMYVIISTVTSLRYDLECSKWLKHFLVQSEDLFSSDNTENFIYWYTESYKSRYLDLTKKA